MINHTHKDLSRKWIDLLVTNARCGTATAKEYLLMTYTEQRFYCVFSRVKELLTAEKQEWNPYLASRLIKIARMLCRHNMHQKDCT